MDLEQVVASGMASEVAQPFDALGESLGRLPLEEADAHKPRPGLDEDEPKLVLARALVELARPIHAPALARVYLGRERVAVLVLELHDLPPSHGGEADGLIQGLVVAWPLSGRRAIGKAHRSW